MKRRIALSAAAVILLVGGGGLLAACSEAYGDAPVEGKADRSAAKQFQMPDGFSNFAAKCDGPNMVYTLYHGSGAYGGIAVAPNDPRCTSG